MDHWRIKSYAQYLEDYRRAAESPNQFWGDIAQTFVWKKPWTDVQNANLRSGEIAWFCGATLNITENCIDRHLTTRSEQTAVIFVPNDPRIESQRISYQELHDEVCRTANALRDLGIKKGDRVCLYMPMIPELLFSVLACARMGAVHSVVFGGFSAESLATRIQDCEARLVITASQGQRGEKWINLKETVDTALNQFDCSSVSHVLTVRLEGTSCPWNSDRDIDWTAARTNKPNTFAPTEMDTEDPLFVLYTSGSTGTPKGIQHTTGGYMVWTAYTFANVFQVDQESIHWCTADIGWITGHSYLIYGPLLCGATTVLYEGIPTWPDPSRLWKTIDQHKVTHFYTAPTAIRSLQANGDRWLEDTTRSSLKVLGSVGEPINASAWNWYRDRVGRGACPVVDTWWQTETGGIMISALAGITDSRPAYAGLPLPGVEPVLVDDDGAALSTVSATGSLCIRSAWPGMLRGVYRNRERFLNAYLRPYPGLYFTGDGAKRDPDGCYRITGRVDDVLNISGHRIGTAELENAINKNPAVSESAVVGVSDEIKGQAICAFIVKKEGVNTPDLTTALKDEVTRHIGPFARPQLVIPCSGLPKTRSGKIMRRILRKIAMGEQSDFGDTSTLLDPEVVRALCSDYKRFTEQLQI
jgi:acetyl-CoA synthetase